VSLSFCHAVRVSAALVSAEKVMHCIQCPLAIPGFANCSQKAQKPYGTDDWTIFTGQLSFLMLNQSREGKTINAQTEVHRKTNEKLHIMNSMNITTTLQKSAKVMHCIQCSLVIHGFANYCQKAHKNLWD